MRGIADMEERIRILRALPNTRAVEHEALGLLSYVTEKQIEGWQFIMRKRFQNNRGWDLLELTDGSPLAGLTHHGVRLENY